MIVRQRDLMEVIAYCQFFIISWFQIHDSVRKVLENLPKTFLLVRIFYHSTNKYYECITNRRWLNEGGGG